jgi:hypothetical protein
MIHLILFLILLSIVVRLIVRIVFLPFRYGGYRRRGWGRGYGYGYGYGCGRSYGGGLLPLLGLLALGRLFGRRW